VLPGMEGGRRGTLIYCSRGQMTLILEKKGADTECRKLEGKWGLWKGPTKGEGNSSSKDNGGRYGMEGGEERGEVSDFLEELRGSLRKRKQKGGRWKEKTLKGGRNRFDSLRRR